MGDSSALGSPCLHLLPLLKPGQTFLQCMWPAPSGLTDPGHLLSPEQLPVAQWMDKNLLLVYKYSTPVKPINVALRL